MAWSFADSFDLYGSVGDMVNTGYWDVGTSMTGGVAVGSPGRFSGGQCLRINGSSPSVLAVKASNVNDGVHHFVCSFQQNNAAISGTTAGLYFCLFDGATAQCTVVFTSGGSILITSGAYNGTVLATYANAFPVNNTWFAFEIEVVVHNTAGSFKVRKNGNVTEDFTATGLNTRVSANNYANKLNLGSGVGVAFHYIDDFFWRSDASAVAWLGDIRCYSRMPVSDISTQVSRSPPTQTFLSTGTSGFTGSFTAGIIRFVPFSPTRSGVVTGMTFNFNTGITGHCKMAVYDATGTGGGPGNLLAQSAELTNPTPTPPTPNYVTASVAAGPLLLAGSNYWLALWSDVTIVGNGNSQSSDNLTLAYAGSFPATAAGFVVGSAINGFSIGVILASNALCVSDPQQDGFSTYVWDNNPGDQDFYGLTSLPTTPAVTFMTTVRGYMIKSDAGSRTATVQMKSGGATVAAPTVVLTTSGWLWAWRSDITDPATGAAWTAAAVNALQIGPKVVA